MILWRHDFFATMIDETPLSDIDTILVVISQIKTFTKTVTSDTETFAIDPSFYDVVIEVQWLGLYRRRKIDHAQMIIDHARTSSSELMKCACMNSSSVSHSCWL